MTAIPATRWLRLLLAFTLWSAAFVGLYALQAVGCAYGWSPATHRFVLILAFLAANGVVIGLCWSLYADRHPHAGPPDGFFRRVGLLAGIAAAISTLVVFMPIIFVSICV